MSARAWPVIAAILATIAAIAFALTVRLPLPFSGFAALTAAGLALAGTLAIGLVAPVSWLWTEAERLRNAFSRRHGLSDTRSGLALAAITQAHHRADLLRDASVNFVDDLRAKAEGLADRLDAAAREIFYAPDALALHRKTLVRAELIEDAVAGHAALRARGESAANAAQMAESRARVSDALDALEAAFDGAETRAADSLLANVEIASATAEALLAPRRPKTDTTERTAQ